MLSKHSCVHEAKRDQKKISRKQKLLKNNEQNEPNTV